MTDLYNLELLDESRRLVQQSRTLLDMSRIQNAQSRAIIEDAWRVIAATSARMAAHAVNG